MVKIGGGMLAGVLEFTFSGYGWVWDMGFLKIIFQHGLYQYSRFRNLLPDDGMQLSLKKIYTRIKEIYSRLGEKLSELMELDKNEKWYLRGR
jgi:hypothetical protein